MPTDKYNSHPTPRKHLFARDGGYYKDTELVKMQRTTSYGVFNPN